MKTGNPINIFLRNRKQREAFLTVAASTETEKELKN